jgi:tRNA G10  N-methylase Trm11
MKHPAPYSPAVLTEIQAILDLRIGRGGNVLDPFGGIGGIHDLIGYDTLAWEIEKEWATISLTRGKTIWRDARIPVEPKVHSALDAIVTSPTYGNRMADHHDAKDGSYRRTYRHLLGRPLTEGNSGGMQWGEEYRQLHREVYAAVTPLVREGGLFILNIKDHIRAGKHQLVGYFHAAALVSLGWRYRSMTEIPTKGFRFGQNHNLRLPERLYTFVKQGSSSRYP